VIVYPDGALVVTANVCAIVSVVSPDALVEEANFAAPVPRFPKYVDVEEMVKVSDCGTVAVKLTVSSVIILTVVLPVSPKVPVRPIVLFPVVVAFTIWKEPFTPKVAFVPILTYTVAPGEITVEPFVMVSVVDDVRATPTVAPELEAARVEDAEYGPPLLMSTSAKVRPAGITNSDGNVKITVVPEAIPVGVVKTNE
jgi:hypothetical protein